MAQSEAFRQLLTEAIYRMSACEGGKPIQVVQDEVGYALNKRGGGSAVEYWRQGHRPKLADVEALARLIRQRSDLDAAWLATFLQSAGHPQPQALCQALFPSPPPDAAAMTAGAPVETPLLFVPNKAYRTLMGRAALVSEALTALQDQQGRWIVALDGLGGIGKTALAREVVAQALQRQLFAQVIWINAATGAGGQGAATGLTLDDIFTAIAQQMGLPGLLQLPEAEKALRIQAALRRQRLLVVLDNLATAATPQAWLIDRLYAMLNPSKALCTSRQRFVGNVYAIHLEGLPTAAAVQLIREEAHERRLFALTTVADPVLHTISAATGGSPLALKLVVGQLGYLPLETVLSQLHQAQTAVWAQPGAQESDLYHAIYATGWPLLSPAGQQLLLAMSLLIPGVGAAAAVLASVSGLTTAALSRALQEGWQLSWLETAPVEAESADVPPLPLRYYLHPLTAQFLLWEVCRLGEQLTATAQAPLVAAQESPAPRFFTTLLACFANALTYLLQQLQDYGASTPPVEERAWLMHLLPLALQLPALWPLTRQVLVKAAPKLEQAGHRRDWLPIVEQGLARSRHLADAATAAELALQAGFLYQLLGEYEPAVAALSTSADTFAALGDHPKQARALNRWAYVARLQRRYAEATQLAQAALALLDATAPERGSSYTVLGAVAFDFQQWPEAVQHFRQALALWQAAGDQRMIARRLRDLGPALRAQNQYAEAIACYTQAIQIFGEIDDPVQQAVTRTNLGVVYTAMGQPAQAIALYRQAEPIFRQTYDTRQLAMLFNNWALAYQAQQQPAQARTAYAQSITYWEAVGDEAALAVVLDGLGLLYLEQRAYADALPVLQRAHHLLAALANEAVTASLYQEVALHLAEARRGEPPSTDKPRNEPGAL